MKYALLIVPGMGCYWWRDTGTQWVHEDTLHRFPKTRNPAIQVVEEAEASSFAKLDHTKTDLYKPESECGWLSPNGKFFGCASQEHDRLARLVIGVPVPNLEKSGWARVQRTIMIDRDPTDKQRNWAYLNGRVFHNEAYN